MKLTLQQLETHLWGAANILWGKTAGQDYENYILWLCDQGGCEAAAGFGDAAFHDAVQVIGYFNYINRVADALGVDPEPGIRAWEEP